MRGVRALAAVLSVAMVTAACSGGRPPAATISSVVTSARSVGVAVRDCLTASRCYRLRQFRVAYGIQPLLERGIDGRGETVVLLELAAPAPAKPPSVTDIRGDLARFDRVFGLPAARLQVVNNLVRSASPWLANGEEVEDAEMVHALAPQAGIRVILISDGATRSPAKASADLAAALHDGLTDGAVISNSGSWGEQCFTAAEIARFNAALEAARSKHVTVVNSSGDNGASANNCPGATAFADIKDVNLMASDPLVLAAGGTSLDANRTTGAYLSETVWSAPQVESPNGYSESSGGGFSHRFPRPAYQAGVPGIGAHRGVPDVAADADPNTGLALALTGRGHDYTVMGAGGTSAAAPLWAALIALADQYAGRHLGFVNPAIYRIGRSAAYHTAFHQITSGTNTVRSGPLTIHGYQATPGWNPVTGWGSPDAQVLVPLLARTVSQ